MTLHTQDKPRARRPGRASDPAATIAIGEIARQFDVSLRTLRFYEDRGLLVPRREGTARLYSPRDKERLQAILELKRLGFTLTEVGEILAAEDKKSSPAGFRLRSDQVLAQIAHLERKRRDIDGAIDALRGAQKDAAGNGQGTGAGV